jgi:hypothetical protein
MRSTITGTAGSYRLTLLAGGAAVAATIPGVALAQDQGDEPDAGQGSNVIIVTASKREETLQDQDVDFTGAAIVSERRNQKINTFTQKLRIVSDFDGPLNFLIGGFCFDQSIKQDSSLITGTAARSFAALLADKPLVFSAVEAAFGLPQGAIFSAGPLTAERFSMDNRAISVFGTVDFELVDGLVFTAGFNCTDDKKDFALSQQAFDELANINPVDAFYQSAMSPTHRALVKPVRRLSISKA